MTLNDYVTNLNIEENLYGNLSVYPTADGSISLHNSSFHEGFHSASGAWKEAREKFLIPAQIERFSCNTNINILDVCVGMGYNTACIVEQLIERSIQFQWIGLEIDSRPIKIGLESYNFKSHWSKEVQQILTSIQTNGCWKNNKNKGCILWGDARHQISSIPKDLNFDLILLDAFSPCKCPMLWSEEFLSKLAKKLAPDGLLITYSTAAAIRSSLRRAGLELGSQIPLNNSARQWSNGTIGISNNHQPIQKYNWEPLTAMEEEHLLTRAAVPYRDPSGLSSNKVILQRREREQKTSNMEITNSWRRRWARRINAKPVDLK